VSRAIAVSCAGVSKRFVLVDQGSAWRLAFGAGVDVPVFEALKDISFEVPKGQFVGVLGRNGAGKSTLLRVTGGVYSADTGQVVVSGALSGIYELGLVGNPQLTGRAYAERLLTVHGFSKSELNAMIADIQDFSELGDRFDDPVLTYSAGMTARLFFSTATAGSYDVYLLDEILSVGDQHFQAKCWRRLRERVSRGASGVLVTHDWSAIVRMCETAHILENGKMKFSGPSSHAARIYLYGESARQTYAAGTARFLERPAEPLVIAAGDDLVFKVNIELLQTVPVSCTCCVERLQPGYGWETSLMTRKAIKVGHDAGRHQIEVSIPHVPLDPGTYQISLHLTKPDPEIPGRLVLLDGWTWLNGDGIALEVTGDSADGLILPMTWRLEQPEARSA
jgi:lipopolysaccharide transport system ATP-binding protein